MDFIKSIIKLIVEPEFGMLSLFAVVSYAAAYGSTLTWQLLLVLGVVIVEKFIMEVV